jgi:hypothetical protein
MGTMQDFFNDVHEIGKKIAATPLQMYEKKLSKMSDRQVVREYWKQKRINPNSKEYVAVQTEITKRRVESGHDEIVFTLGKEAKFDRGCTCSPKNAKNDKNKFWGR